MRILWAGMSGMHWFNMVSLVHAMFNAYSIPRALIMQVGGNDIGAWSTQELWYRIKFALYVINKHVTRLHTDIFEHITSLVMALFLIWAMERSRNRVNRGVRSYLLKIRGYAIKYLDLDDGHKALFTHS